MACADTEKYFSDYIDGVLDASTRKRVDQHLADCAGCREALESLRKMVDQLGKLPRPDAPPDFLDRLHARMEKEPLFKRACRALFMPFQVKIPLELVSAAALGVLIFFMVSPMQQAPVVVKRQAVKEDVMASRPAPRPEGAGQARPEKQRLIVNQNEMRAVAEPEAVKPFAPIIVSRPGALKPKAAKIGGKPLAPITIALRIGPERARPAFAELPAGDQATGLEDKAGETQKMKADEMADAAAPAAPATEEMPAAGRAAALAESPRSFEDTLRQIEHLVVRLHGRVVAVEKDAAGRPESIRIGLPSNQYDRFISQLGSYGKYTSPAPKILSKKYRMLDMVIQFIPPA